MTCRSLGYIYILTLPMWRLDMKKLANSQCVVLTPVPAVEYSEQEGGGNGDGVAALLQHLLIAPHHL